MTLSKMIIYEDSDVLVINKPAGLMVHPSEHSIRAGADGKTKEKTLVDLLVKKYPEMKNVGEQAIMETGKLKVEDDDEYEGVVSPVTSDKSQVTLAHRPGIVHRLDRDTSGIMIIAKTQDAFIFLKKQFQERSVRKVYHAIVWGDMKQDRGIINAPIGRSKNDFRRWHAGRGTRGDLREATTEWKVLKRITDKITKFTYLEVRPKTGRTHQIRVHMKYAQHPIVGDTLYTNNPIALGFDRMALHSYSLSITLPSGEKYLGTAPLPEEFKKLV